MIIVGIIEEQGDVPQATWNIGANEVYKDDQGKVVGGGGTTNNPTYNNQTGSGGGVTVNNWQQAGFLSGFTSITYLGGEDGKQVFRIVNSYVNTDWNAPNLGTYALPAYTHTTTTSPLIGTKGSLNFSTTTTDIISAKDTTLGTSTDTYTSLTTIYSSTTSSVPKVTTLNTVIYGNSTTIQSSYTELTQYWTKQLCYSTRYEVFDNSDGVTLAIATAGNGGLVSYRTLSPGEVVGEASYKFVTYDSQIFTVGTEPFIASDHIPPPQTSNFSNTYVDIATAEVWYGGGGEDGGGAWTPVTITEQESSVAYIITRTANRGFIGTHNTDISSVSSEIVWDKMTTHTIEFNGTVGDTTITTFKTTIPSTTNITTTKYVTNGAFVADNGPTLFLTTTTAGVPCAVSTMSSITGVQYKPYHVVQVVDGYTGYAQGNVIQAEVVNKDSVPWRNGPVYKITAEPGFILEPVGPPCIGGYNATTPQGLGFDDNCPFSFPAHLLWEAANDSRYAAVSASSFYIGGVPLISHGKKWEWEGRTYAWLSIDANGGTLRVNTGGTATSSFTIRVTGNCSYSGGLSEVHAGGEYYSSSKATLVANSPLKVSVENTTSSFAAGVHQITRPMSILPNQYGSVVLAGLVELYPPNLKNNANAE